MAFQIVPADDRLLSEIEIWLDAEEAIYKRASQEWEEADYEGDRPVRGFRCNWDSAKKGWREGRAKIHVLLVEGEPVGFLNGTDILEIRPDLRGKGYGRILADFMIQAAWDEGRSVVEIEVAPASAEPFWQRMGFTLVEDRQGYGGGTFAYKILPRAFELGDGVRAEYTVAFFTQKARYSQDPKPFIEYTGEGVRLADGHIQLPERAYCFNPTDDQHVDYFVKIEVDGDVVHFDKAKREESELCGVLRDAGGDFYIERINPGHGNIAQ